jgi:23S rRNA pseudouridine2604 synthase
LELLKILKKTNARNHVEASKQEDTGSFDRFVGAMEKQSTRLNKFISESGLCSRRQADRYIEEGSVFINGRRGSIGDKVFAGDRVMVNGHELEPKEAKNLVFIALNKPVGITSTTEPNVRDNIVDFVNHSERIFPIGRLDKDSQGLIFLTNDGDIVNKILRAGNAHEKEYVVTVNKPVTDEFIRSMASGVPMLGGTTKKCVVKQEAVFVFRIVLIQGLNRQIRRMCEHFGYEVTKLERVRIMNIGLKGLVPGDWRELTPEEMEIMHGMVEDSSSTVNTISTERRHGNKGHSHKKREHQSGPSSREGGVHFKRKPKPKGNEKGGQGRSKNRRGAGRRGR